MLMSERIKEVHDIIGNTQIPINDDGAESDSVINLLEVH